MSAIYYSCQDRFRRPMPKKSEEEIYWLTIEWYKDNMLIDGDDWPEMKKFYADKNKYENKIEKQTKKVLNPEHPIEWTDMIDEQPPQI